MGLEIGNGHMGNLFLSAFLSVCVCVFLITLKSGTRISHLAPPCLLFVFPRFCNGNLVYYRIAVPIGVSVLGTLGGGCYWLLFYSSCFCLN